ncbi:alpha/beta fold hydrolase [Halomarina oriensis]|uniref:Alpha/beta fold hydrolase n=1 Tax=Halomarina oriensis TaxID=671145 RepID=A0A6B0GS13_9EURY|nr:alpha/beta hydrolase [Halomarina oriensis]MWG35483.1 alpha/beta fold hydrolase [Halomarina oriensis]
MRTETVPGDSEYVDTGAVRLHVRTAGPADGPPVVLLHGFPEFWYGWHRQLDALAEAGYRVLVPDQRGYNLSDRPATHEAYRVDNLADDVRGVLDATGHDEAAIVGHDWGAMVAWVFAQEHPERVERLGILNVPHPAAFGETLRGNWEQVFRSWYAGFFQVPRLPEAAMRARDYRLLERALTGSARPGTFTDDDLRRYRTAWGRTGALTGMLNWYRANGLGSGLFDRDERIEPETLILWGTDDVALVEENAERSLSFCADGTLERFEASHWLQHERSEEVSERLVAFLS